MRDDRDTRGERLKDGLRRRNGRAGKRHAGHAQAILRLRKTIFHARLKAERKGGAILQGLKRLVHGVLCVDWVMVFPLTIPVPIRHTGVTRSRQGVRDGFIGAICGHAGV